MPPNFQILVEPGSGETLEHFVPVGTYVLGREESSCDIPIQADGVGPQHARLTLSPEQCVVENLGSPSETFHGEERLEGVRSFDYPLSLRMGTATLRIGTQVSPDFGEDFDATIPADRTILADPGERREWEKKESSAGHYIKGREIAQGGMGAVLEADDELLGRTVAMKVIRLDLIESASVRLRFIREATVLARLEHPNIVPIHEMGKDAEGRLFYTMKKVEGRTLQAILDALRAGDPDTVEEFTLNRLLNVFRKVCDAMAFAHSRGVIHRDLKPENIMIGQFGEVLVMDWGLAKVLSDEAQSELEMRELLEYPAGQGDASAADDPSTGSTSMIEEWVESELSKSSQNLTMVGSVMGSPQYMPPEQAEGRIQELDERSDIYSLGAILYAILTLRPPAEGQTTDEVLTKVKQGQITAPTMFGMKRSSVQMRTSKAVPGGPPGKADPLPHCPGGAIPMALSAVSMKALSVEPAQRHAEVSELSRDVERWQGGFATSAEHLSAARHLKLFIRRHRRLATSVGIALLLITLITTFFMIRLNAGKQAALAASREAVAQRDLAIQEQEKTRRALARASVSLAEAAHGDADGIRMQEALSAVPADLRNSTWRYLNRSSDSSMSRIDLDGKVLQGVAAHPAQAGIIAVVDSEHLVTVLNVRTNERLLQFKAGFNVPGPGSRCILTFSPEGDRIAVCRSGMGGMAIHDAATGRKVGARPCSSSDYLSLGRGGRLLQGNSTHLSVWDTDSGTRLWKIEKEEAGRPIKGFFAPDGHQVIIYGGKKGIQVLAGDSGEVIRTLGGRRGAYEWAMAIHPDGKSLLMRTSGSPVDCISLEDGRKLFEIPFPVWARRVHIDFMGNGLSFVTAVKGRDGAQLIKVWNARTGKLIRSILGGVGDPVGMCIHPLSNELIVVGPDSRTWDLSGPPPSLELHANNVRLTSSVSFLGSDDIIIGKPKNPGILGIHQISENKLEIHSTPLDIRQAVSSASANGHWAAASNPGQHLWVKILKKSGENVGVSRTVEVGFWAYRLRMNASGDRLAAMERPRNTVSCVIDPSSGEILFKPKVKDAKNCNDLGWVANDGLVGLMTVNELRGNPGTEEKIVRWDGTTGEILREASHHSAMDVMAVAPDGKRFAEAGAERTVRLRDSKTLAVLKEFRAHDAPITALAWHPTQPVIATGSEDLSIKLWNYETMDCTLEFHGILVRPSDLVFGPEGTRLVANVPEMGTAFLWDLAPSGDRVATDPLESYQSKLLRPEQLIGRYAQDVIENNWQSGEILAVEGNPHQLLWRNDAGKSWGLTIQADGTLFTDDRNPYKDHSPHFKVIMDEQDSETVAGFRFQGAIHLREK